MSISHERRHKTESLPREDNMNDGLDMVGREGFVDELMAQLIGDADDSSKLCVIYVLGERAIGKTALVRSIYDRLDIKRRFERRAWVRVLTGSGLEDILFDVLTQTTIEDLKNVNHLQEKHLTEMLEKTLTEQTYLVVLDILEIVCSMKELLNCFADSGKGSRVIITSRKENMCLHSRSRCHLNLHRLTEEESYQLLMKSGGTDDAELTGEILDKCKGYPPMIRLLGGLLSTVEEIPRSTLADGVTNYPTLKEIISGVTNYPTLGEIISLSYASLPAWLRPCLLYLVLFPRESEIPVRRLFNIWNAEGLLSSRQARMGQEPGDSTKECLAELVARNMIHVMRRKLDGSTKTCLMPGFLHDFLSEMTMDVGTSEISADSMSTSSRQPRVSPIAVKICRSANGEQDMRTNTPHQTRPANMSSLSLSSTKHENCSPRKLQYIAIKMDEENQQCKQMHMSNGANTQYFAEYFCSFMLFTTWKQGEHFKETKMFLKPLGLRRRFPWLKVLDLEHVYKPTLPKRLGRIVPNLRYLGLRWTFLDSLPRSVQVLCHLNTLDLRHTNVTNVPSCILKAGSLQHLYMNEVCLDRSIHRNASYQKSLANLKTLWGLYIGAKSPLLDVLGKLTGLQKLGLTCHYVVASRAATSVASLTNLQSLRFRSLNRFGHPACLKLSNMSRLLSLSNLLLLGALKATDLEGLPRNLQILTLSRTQLKKDPMQVLKELNGLTCLRLLAGSYKGGSMTCNEGTFPALQVLKLWKLDLLKKWTIQANALPRLRGLEIRNCTRLEHIVGLEHVQGLEEINLMNVARAVTMTAEALSREVVVIARELTVSPPQEGYDDNEEEDDEESSSVESRPGDDNDCEEGDSYDNRGTNGGANEDQEEYADNEDDQNKELNSIEVEASDDNFREEGDINDNRGTDEGEDEEQGGYNHNGEDDDKESNGVEIEAADDNDRVEGDSNNDRGTGEGADEEQEEYMENKEDHDEELIGNEVEAGDDNNHEEGDSDNRAINEGVDEEQGGYNHNEEDDNKESNGTEIKVANGNDCVEGESNNDRGTGEEADEEQEEYIENEEDHDEELNGIEVEASNDNNREEGDSNDNRGTDEGGDEEQGGYNHNEGDDDKESNGAKIEATDDNDRVKGDSNDRGIGEGAYAEQGGYNHNEEDDDKESNGAEIEAADDNDRVEGDSNNDRGISEGEDEEQGEHNHNVDDDDKESNGAEIEAVDDNYRVEGDSNSNRGTGEGAGGEQEEYGDNEEDQNEELNSIEVEAFAGNEEKGNDEREEYEDEGEQQQNETNDCDEIEEEEEEEDKEKEDDNIDSEEGDNNDDKGNDGAEDEEQEIVGEAEAEDVNEKGDDGNIGEQEEVENQNGAEAEDSDDDHEDGDLNNDDNEREINSSKINIKLELNMEVEAHLKNELTLTVVWKNTRKIRRRKIWRWRRM